jgi:hypothetical protein
MLAKIVWWWKRFTCHCGGKSSYTETFPVQAGGTYEVCWQAKTCPRCRRIIDLPMMTSFRRLSPEAADAR